MQQLFRKPKYGASGRRDKLHEVFLEATRRLEKEMRGKVVP